MALESDNQTKSLEKLKPPFGSRENPKEKIN